ncbi:hypothetical protein O3M35_008985 [Rhynocoris fuscipes]|uniref:Uncharacterized protein n=1 Tax=Rhynocoris fuscipes TaxID=488301 RepID=A0AAW1D1B6_9HEMI
MSAPSTGGNKLKYYLEAIARSKEKLDIYSTNLKEMLRLKKVENNREAEAYNAIGKRIGKFIF